MGSVDETALEGRRIKVKTGRRAGCFQHRRGGEIRYRNIIIVYEHDLSIAEQTKNISTLKYCFSVRTRIRTASDRDGDLRRQDEAALRPG